MTWSGQQMLAPSPAPGEDGGAGRAGAKRPRPRLGNEAIRSSPGGGDARWWRELQVSERKRRRRERVVLRDRLRKMTGLERVRGCGWASVTGSGGPVVRLSGKRPVDMVAGYSGLSTCGSVWACPVCAAKIAARRAAELADVMRVVLDRNGSASMLSLTMRHHPGQTLEECWDAASKAWSSVTSGKQWVADQKAGGLIGWAKVIEVTRGGMGWHVHIHALLCWDRPVSDAFAEHTGLRMWSRWARSLKRSGFDSVAHLGGFDIRMADLESNGLADYFVKLAREVTAGQNKEGRGGGRTPFQILTNAVEGLADDVVAWWEFERASFGRRQLTWSLGDHDLRRWAGLGAEETDEEIAETDLGGDDVLAIPGPVWREIRGTRVSTELLEVVEQCGVDRAAEWLDRRGLASIRVTAVPRPRRPPE